MAALRCYDPASNGGGGGIHVWLDGLSSTYRAQIAVVFELLQVERRWDDLDEVKELRGACEGLTEIIVEFLVGKTEIHIRILGFYGPDRGEFTLLTGFEKTNDNAIYGFYCPQARQRMEGVQRDGRRAPPCEFP
jgi:hypothetical protein